MDGIDPALAARDRLPSVRESITVVNERAMNWSIVPCPTHGWAKLVYPDLDPEAAFERLWHEIAHVCRLDEADPVSAWRSRLDRLRKVATTLDRLELDRVHFQGPGTDLTIGLLPGSRWIAAQLETDRGVVHMPNIPTEEVFATPDPERVDGRVRTTKPLFTSGRLIRELEVEFDRGRAVEISGTDGGEPLRSLARRDEGAARLGEVALVDHESRIGRLGRIFYDTLLDENAASHVALGQGYTFGVVRDQVGRVNESEIHIDFMIGSDEVTVSGVTRSGQELALLSGGVWQV
jgi:aminopeptidase